LETSRRTRFLLAGCINFSCVNFPIKMCTASSLVAGKRDVLNEKVLGILKLHKVFNYTLCLNLYYWIETVVQTLYDVCYFAVSFP
jgi:hypothetical protein